MIVQANMGSTFTTILTSSTCCTLHSSDEQNGFFATARLRNFKVSDGVSVALLSFAVSSSASSLIEFGIEGLEAMFTTALLESLEMQLFIEAATTTYSFENGIEKCVSISLRDSYKYV